MEKMSRIWHTILKVWPAAAVQAVELTRGGKKFSPWLDLCRGSYLWIIRTTSWKRCFSNLVLWIKSSFHLGLVGYFTFGSNFPFQICGLFAAIFLKKMKRKLSSVSCEIWPEVRILAIWLVSLQQRACNCSNYWKQSRLKIGATFK